jgi:hypothetical protein
MKLIISDLDNTLGIIESEIVDGIHLINSYQRLCDICFITGRSLTSLNRFNSYFKINTYLSPWGGGNLLKKITDNKYELINPITPFNENITDKLATKVFIPKSKSFSINDEIQTLNENMGISNYLVCVGGFRKIEKPEIDFQTNLGLKDAYFKIYSPYRKPRLHLVNISKDKYDTIIYIGDDHPDADCIKHVDHFLAPINSFASKYKPTFTYEDHKTLKNILDDIVI